MGHPLDRIICASPSRRRIEKRNQALRQEVESLRELRQIAGKAQAEIAAALKIKQPSISKIESQTDMYLSTLRAYVEAVGGELELVVRLAQQPMSRFYRLSDSIGRPARAPRRSARPRRRSGVSS